MKNILKRRLKAGEQTIGVWISVPSSDITETLSRLGFDWLVFDNEHSPLDVWMIQNLMQAMGGTDTVPLVRVEWNDPVVIKRVLDIGAYGVIIPWINSRKDAVNGVKACKYPPEGIRGSGPRRPRTILGDKEYFATSNEEILIMVQIETKNAVENLQEILSVDGVDGLVIGPGDLSASLGFLGNWFAPEVQATIDQIFDVGKAAGVITGIFSVDLEDAKKRLAQGFQFISVGSDLGFLLQGAKNTITDLANYIKHESHLVTT